MQLVEVDGARIVRENRVLVINESHGVKVEAQAGKRTVLVQQGQVTIRTRGTRIVVGMTGIFRNGGLLNQLLNPWNSY